MDEFKKYLQQHRDEMDIDAPAPQLLQRIQSQTVKQKAVLRTMIIRYAAAACVLAVIILGVSLLTKSGGEKITGTAGIIPQKNIPPAIIEQPTIDTINNIAVVNTRETAPAAETRTATKRPSQSYELMRSFEHNYGQLVSLQLKNIRNTPVYGETPDYFDSFKNSFAQIDADENIIKHHIKEKGLNDVLLEQLINVYQQKLNLLKSLQQEINKMNKKLKENQQPSDTLTGHFINI